MNGAPRNSIWPIVLGLVIAIGILLVTLFAIGIADVVATITVANPVILIAMVAVGIAWLGSWSIPLRLAFDELAVPISAPRTVLLYMTLQFANHVTPLSVMGGEPLAAFFVARVTRTEYDRSFAVIAVTDFLNFLPAVALAIVGVLALGIWPLLGPVIGRTAVALVVTVIGIAIVGYAAWRRRHGLASKLAVTFVRLTESVKRVIPGVPAPSQAAVTRHVEQLLDAIETITVNPATLALGIGFATLGWLLNGTVLWLALVSIGYDTPIVVSLVVVPLVLLLAVVPLPGGVGVVEPMLIVVLVASADVPPDPRPPRPSFIEALPTGSRSFSEERAWSTSNSNRVVADRIESKSPTCVSRVIPVDCSGHRRLRPVSRRSVESITRW